jgi:hypothetical protein
VGGDISWTYRSEIDMLSYALRERGRRMPDEATETGVDAAALEAIRFHYIKSRSFRVIHVDGAIGGLTPRGYIHAALYSERRTIPQITEQEVLPDGQLGKPKPVSSKEHVTRDMEADLILDARTARELGSWLMARADELERVKKQMGDA